MNAKCLEGGSSERGDCQPPDQRGGQDGRGHSRRSNADASHHKAWVLSLRNGHNKDEGLNDDLQPRCRALTKEFDDTFANKLPSFPSTRALEATIDMGTNAPVAKKPYRMSVKEKDKCKRQLTELLEAELIQSSTSPWVAPILFVRKKNGEMRMFADFTALNARTHRMHYPLPRIDDVFDQLLTGRVFSLRSQVRRLS